MLFYDAETEIAPVVGFATLYHFHEIETPCELTSVKVPSCGVNVRLFSSRHVVYEPGVPGEVGTIT
jgi:hypothetical protein